MIIKLGIVFLFAIATFVDNIEAQTTLASYSWKYLDFQFPTPAIRDYAIRNGDYIKGNSFPIDMDVYNGGSAFSKKKFNNFCKLKIKFFYLILASGTKLFVTMPRLFSGTPITLGTISGVNSDGGPIIAPFPNYDWNVANGCNGFISVFRVAVS